MSLDYNAFLREGLTRLKTPVLPLVHIVQWLYLSGPFQTVAEMLPQLSEPIEMEHGTYPEPAALLANHGEALTCLHYLKQPVDADNALPYIEDEYGILLDAMEIIGQWTRHLILSQELEKINSLLCAPQGCTLCCIGPRKDQQQLYFEIPLQADETSLFPLPSHEDHDTRNTVPDNEPPLLRGKRPFYEAEPALYHWQNGWSLILPRNSNCPHLDGRGSCSIYPTRPAVCRKPQIFPYLLEKTAKIRNGKEVYILRNKILAVWDCPYVKAHQEEIASYAELCGLEPVFRQNKK